MRATRHEVPPVVTAVPPYVPTWEFGRPFVNEAHAAYASCPMDATEGHLIDTGIDGWLRREDALKLYELAYFAEGDVLELGAYHGLSTSILSAANRDAGRKKEVVTVELDGAALAVARANLEARGLAAGVRFVEGEAAAQCRALAAAGRRFAFAFVDHDHAYDSVLAVCRELSAATLPGAFVLFHDYLDARNYEPGNTQYGVFQAVRDGLPADFEPWGIYGVTGLFRKRG